MTITKSGVKVLLIGLYIAAIWIRVGDSSVTSYPYFKGESATNYRHSVAIGRQGRLPAVDKRFFWPEGYSPARVKPAGVEAVTGFAFRLVSQFSDIPNKRFVSLLSVMFFSLCVFTFYGLTQNLWACRAAGLLAAFLVAFSRPVVDATSGGEYVHGPFALLLVSLHVWLLLAWRRKPVTSLALWAGLAALGLLAVWETGPTYLALLAVTALALPGAEERARRNLLTWHLGAVILGAVLLPHLRAQRMIVDWPVILIATATIYAHVRHRLPRKIPPVAYVTVTALVVLLLVKPFQAGGVEMLSEIEYWFYRLRFAAGKPADPQLLPESVRFLWTHDRSIPAPHTLFAFFLPVLLLLPPALFSLRDIRRRVRRNVWLPVIVGLSGILLFWLDRAAIYAAALILFPLAAVSMVALGKHLARRGVLVAVVILLVVSNGVAPFGKANAMYRAGELLGLSSASPDGFARASLGNPDLALVRHLVSRTSVRDPFLTPPDISSLVVTFAGRKTVLVPGIASRRLANRTRDVLSQFYENEDVLYEYCRTSGIAYVVYSIDLLLDTSRYSPLYASGRRGSPEDALARRMHFAPENLRHFNLVYQNDIYRLFKVTKDSELSFLTDHPPVYQRDILERHGDTLESFYTRVVDILATYHTAITAQARGDEEDAIRRFRYCLGQAPRFSRAWMGVGDSLLRLRDFRAANAAYLRVLENAPDDSHALYYAALSFGHIKEVDRALGLLQVLFSTGGDRELLTLGKALKDTLERGIPLDGSPRPVPTP